MGGTSTDIAVIQGGKLVATREGRIGGYPLRVQMVDVHTIGAGGGSIATLDDGGALKVGPESAEADPGPACYGRGGTAPRSPMRAWCLECSHPASFAGGIRLDRAPRRDGARSHCATNWATRQRAAQGILKVCNEAMAEAIRVRNHSAGHRSARLALVALGGAGPVHAGRVAQALGIRRIIVPSAPWRSCGGGSTACARSRRSGTPRSSDPRSGPPRRTCAMRSRIWRHRRAASWPGLEHAHGVCALCRRHALFGPILRARSRPWTLGD